MDKSKECRVSNINSSQAIDNYSKSCQQGFFVLQSGLSNLKTRNTKKSFESSSFFDSGQQIPSKLSKELTNQNNSVKSLKQSSVSSPINLMSSEIKGSTQLNGHNLKKQSIGYLNRHCDQCSAYSNIMLKINAELEVKTNQIRQLVKICAEKESQLIELEYKISEFNRVLPKLRKKLYIEKVESLYYLGRSEFHDERQRNNLKIINDKLRFDSGDWNNKLKACTALQNTNRSKNHQLYSTVYYNEFSQQKSKVVDSACFSPKQLDILNSPAANGAKQIFSPLSDNSVGHCKYKDLKETGNQKPMSIVSSCINKDKKRNEILYDELIDEFEISNYFKVSTTKS